MRTLLVTELRRREELDVHAANDDNKTALELASQMGHLEIVCELLKDAKVDRMNFALIMACESGRLEIVREMLKVANLDVDVSCSVGNTPLILASDKGHAQVVDARPMEPRTLLTLFSRARGVLSM